MGIGMDLNVGLRHSIVMSEPGNSELGYRKRLRKAGAEHQTVFICFFIYKQDGYEMLPSRPGRNRFTKSKSKEFSKSEVWGSGE